MNKNYEHIKELLDKYYRGATTQAEEAELSRFFLTSDTLPEEMEADHELFRVMAEADTFGEAPSDLDSRIMKAIDASMASEQSTPRKSGRQIRRIFFAVSAAAVITLVILIPFRFGNSGSDSMLQPPMASNRIVDTIKNMEIIPQIPEITSETAAMKTAEDPQIQPGAQNTLATQSPKAAVKPKAKSTGKDQSTPEEEYTLSEEDLKALEMTLAALDNASQKLAYAYGCIEDSQERIADTQYMIDRILQ